MNNALPCLCRRRAEQSRPRSEPQARPSWTLGVPALSVQPKGDANQAGSSPTIRLQVAQSLGHTTTHEVRHFCHGAARQPTAILTSLIMLGALSQAARILCQWCANLGQHSSGQARYQSALG